MNNFLFGPYKEELGYEILIIRPLVLSGIERIRSINKENTITVCSISNRKALYNTADKFIGLGSWEVHQRDRQINISKICNEEKYLKLNEKTEYPKHSMPLLKKEWFEIANDIVEENYITISVRYRTEESARNFFSWNRIIENLKSKKHKIICTSPNNTPTKLEVPYLEDFIGKENDDSMGIEMCLHSRSKMCLSTNSGSAGVMLLSNPQKVLIFGGVAGFAQGWNGLHRELLENKEYKTQLIIPPPEVQYNGLCQTSDQQNWVADRVSQITLGEIE